MQSLAFFLFLLLSASFSIRGSGRFFYNPDQIGDDAREEVGDDKRKYKSKHIIK